MQCKYCERTNDKHKFVGKICFKHYQQIRKHGKVSRSVNDPNKIMIIDNVAIMELYDTKGNITARTKFDIEFIPLVSKYKWYHKNGYVRGTSDIKGKKQFLHRLISNCPNDKVIDHVDRNGLNNLSDNLRICTQADNTKNRKYKTVRDYIGIKQVPSGAYQASITVMYKTIYLGSFSTVEEAIAARQAAEIMHFKEYRNVSTSKEGK